MVRVDIGGDTHLFNHYMDAEEFVDASDYGDFHADSRRSIQVDASIIAGFRVRADSSIGWACVWVIDHRYVWYVLSMANRGDTKEDICS